MPTTDDVITISFDVEEAPAVREAVLDNYRIEEANALDSARFTDRDHPAEVCSNLNARDRADRARGMVAQAHAFEADAAGDTASLTARRDDIRLMLTDMIACLAPELQGEAEKETGERSDDLYAWVDAINFCADLLRQTEPEPVEVG